MQRTVLANQHTAVDAYNLAAREGFLQHLSRPLVVGRLVIGRVEHGIVNDEEVGVGGRQSLVAFVLDGIGEVALEYGVGHWQWQQAVRLAVGRTEGAELLLHGLKLVVMDVVGVETLYVDDRIVGAEARQCVDVRIRIVADEESGIEPQHALGVEVGRKPLLEVGLVGQVVAVLGQQALGRGEYRAVAVALNRSAFQYSAATIQVLGVPELEQVVVVEHFAVEQRLVDLVVEVGRKLHAPAVEAIVVQHELAIGTADGQEAVVARPGVVGRAFGYDDAAQVHAALAQLLLDRFRFGRDDEQGLATCHLAGNGGEALLGGFEIRRPIGFGMWPCELYEPLRFPFGRKHTIYYINYKLRITNYGCGEESHVTSYGFPFPVNIRAIF